MFTDLDAVWVFILDGRNFNNIRCADEAMLVEDTEGRIQDFIDKLVKESEKYGLILR